jgi:hypothetical protein
MPASALKGGKPARKAYLLLFSVNSTVSFEYFYGFVWKKREGREKFLSSLCSDKFNGGD